MTMSLHLYLNIEVEEKLKMGAKSIKILFQNQFWSSKIANVSSYRNSGATRFAKDIKIPLSIMEAAKYPGPGYHEHTGNVA